MIPRHDLHIRILNHRLNQRPDLPHSLLSQVRNDNDPQRLNRHQFSQKFQKRSTDQRFTTDSLRDDNSFVACFPGRYSPLVTEPILHISSGYSQCRLQHGMTVLLESIPRLIQYQNSLPPFRIDGSLRRQLAREDQTRQRDFIVRRNVPRNPIWSEFARQQR